MKTIGFIDYYISEWHANNYPSWIKEESDNMGEDFVVKYAWAEKDISPVDGVSTDEWCAKMGIERCNTIEEICEKSDYLLILAPSDPEKHLEYAQKVLSYKKNTYIDKTFAPDFKTAKKIFEISKRYGTRFFSSSALRYANELDELIDSKAVITTGGGGNLDEYIIHQIEMAVKTLNSKACEVCVEKQGDNQYISRVFFENEKTATMLYSPAYAFSICADTKKGALNKEIASPFFQGLIADILGFYITGEVSFDCAQTLEVMKIREAIIKGKNCLGERVKI